MNVSLEDRICVSIAEELYVDVVKALDKCTFVEIRLDLCYLNIEEIKQIFALPKTFVATCRKGKYAEKERIERLTAAIEAGADYVDIEREDSNHFRETLQNIAVNTSCKIIISHHNFERTPDIDGLEQLIADCEAKGADIVKLVTTALTLADCSKILSLYQNHTNLVAFSMSDVGKITRLACLYLGSPFTYASLGTGKAVASGQLSKAALIESINHLK